MHTVYKLTHLEYAKYREHLKNLDSDSRYLRFGYHIKDDMIDTICDRLEKSPLKNRIFVIEDNDCRVIAAGHIAIEAGTVELAFSVLKEYQGQGMGSALMKRCIEWCQNRNIKTGFMVCLARNTAIRKLAQKHGILIQESGEVEAHLTIPSASTASMIAEIAEDSIAMLDHLGKSQRRFARTLICPLTFY
jgi:GNAT superfamily N-acetyltransferase